MKIAVPSAHPKIDAHIETDLCDSKYVLIVDSETMKYEAIVNPITSQGSAFAVELLVRKFLQKNVRKVLANKCSCDMQKLLGLSGIQTMDVDAGTVRSVVEKLKEVCMAETIILPVKEILGQVTKAPGHDRIAFKGNLRGTGG